MITISAFKWVPDFAQGQVRDLRARWALEEAGLPYRTRLLQQGDQDAPEYRALQPFGQVPILEDDGFVLFESGAIVLYIGARSETLLPKDPAARASATQWLIAALNSIEPFLMNIALIDLFYAKEEWAKLRRPGAVSFAERRLSALSKSSGRQALSRWRPLHGRRSDDDDGAQDPQAHRHHHQRPAPRRLYRALHRAPGLQARARCTNRRFQTRCLIAGLQVLSSPAWRSPQASRSSILTGSSRTRTPVAWWTAR